MAGDGGVVQWRRKELLNWGNIMRELPLEPFQHRRMAAPAAEGGEGSSEEKPLLGKAGDADSSWRVNIDGFQFSTEQKEKPPRGFHDDRRVLGGGLRYHFSKANYGTLRQLEANLSNLVWSKVEMHQNHSRDLISDLVTSIKFLTLVMLIATAPIAYRRADRKVKISSNMSVDDMNITLFVFGLVLSCLVAYAVAIYKIVKRFQRMREACERLVPINTVLQAKLRVLVKEVLLSPIAAAAAAGGDRQQSAEYECRLNTLLRKSNERIYLSAVVITFTGSIMSLLFGAVVFYIVSPLFR